VTTHYMDEAERCSRVGYIYLSHLLALGTPQELKHLDGVTPAGTHWLEIYDADTAGLLQRLRAQPGVLQATIFGQSIHALVEQNRTVAELGLSAARVIDAEPSLEDVFVTISRAQMARAAG
jgi:ABC-2 type transport system ATP-binding protein